MIQYFSKINIQIQSWSKKSQVSCRISNPDLVGALFWSVAHAENFHGGRFIQWHRV